MAVRLPAVAVATTLAFGGLAAAFPAFAEATPAHATVKPPKKADKEAKTCANPRQCDHKDAQTNKKAQQQALKNCGGTVSACDHKGGKAKTTRPQTRKQKQAYQACGGTVRACDHHADQAKAKKQKQDYQACGGTVRACDHHADQAKAKKQKQDYQNCGGTIRACEHKEAQAKTKKQKQAYQACGGTIQACDHKAAKTKKPYEVALDVFDDIDEANDYVKAGSETAEGVREKQWRDTNNRTRSGNPAVREPAKVTVAKGKPTPRGFLTWYGGNKYIKMGNRFMGPLGYVANGAVDVANGMPVVEAVHKQGFIASYEFGGELAGAGAGTACGPLLEICSPVGALIGKGAAGMAAEDAWDRSHQR
jgi:hypothetical protein